MWGRGGGEGERGSNRLMTEYKIEVKRRLPDLFSEDSHGVCGSFHFDLDFDFFPLFNSCFGQNDVV